ncbi:membrane-spanning 4-domains subfamily A member 13 isoform X4 [Marmota marmota marmota]|uniref:membrane-spanning 4-domains subfamily A member 13 isoform X4 n=1 Tax=Marmota marmota marmota TaxID=9994 RepID=UPI00209250E3|nr:membrane-spanning 4-domains subfamily A member 13 isoform X4 [Marmota marmota marmota]
MACGNTSTADSLVLGAIQIMIGIFHIFMWYFLLVLYMGQIKGVFGTYEPITYKTGCAFWGIFYIVSGASTIRSTQKSSQYLTIWALIMNIFSVITAFIALCLTVLELSTFHTVSYRNYGQAFVFSGTFAVVVEKKRSKFLLSYAIGVNILSACISIIGITLLLFELTLFGTVSNNSPWSHRSGALLSTYLFLFSILEFCLAVTVSDWGYKANR